MRTEENFVCKTSPCVYDIICVTKKMALMAMQKPGFISCLSLSKSEEPLICDLHDGMPSNSIIETSIKLYEQEIMEGL